MLPQVGAIVSASCSQCKDTVDAEVGAVVADEIVSVTCKACGTSQRFRAPAGGKSKPAGRRVVDVGLSSPEPRPRSKGGRRATDSGDVPMRTPARDIPVPITAPRPVSRDNRTEDVFRRWDAMTAGLMSRHGRPHRAQDSYRLGEVVLHNVHGMGVIEHISEGGELTVLFRRGYQKLPSGEKKTDEPTRQTKAVSTS